MSTGSLPAFVLSAPADLCLVNKQNPFAMIFTKTESLMIVIILLAVFLRVYRLNEFPPALHWDEAFDGFDALRVIETPSHPVFFDGDNGREPLTIYLQAAGLLLWGVRDWALRLVSAFIGIVTIPAVYRLGATLYAGEKHAKAIGTLAAGVLAVSFWHLTLSRLAMRAISFPLLSAITVWLFWRAWRNQRVWDYAFSGAALGLTLYTYLAARLFPLVFISFALIAALLSIYRPFHFPSIDRRQMFVGLGVMLVFMLIVFSPLGIFFLQHPGAFFQRAGQISIFSSNAQGLASLPYNTFVIIRMFIDHGDVDQLRNLPGQPAFNLLTAIGFWIGLVIALAHCNSRPVYLLLLLWCGINLIPSLFSVDIPSSLRTSGTLPPAMIIAADGLMWVWKRTMPKVNFEVLLAVTVTFGGVLTFNDYFNLWGPSKPTYDILYGPTRAVLERAISLSRAADVVLPFKLYGTPSAQFYLANHFSAAKPLQESLRNRPAVWISTGAIERSVVILQKDGSVLVPQPLSDSQSVRLDELLKTGQPLTSPFGQTVATELRIDNLGDFVSPLNPTRPLDVDFGGQIKLFGYNLDPLRVAPGDKVRVTYYWQALVDGEFDYSVVSTLLDSFSEGIGKRIAEPVYETTLWRRGAVVLDSFDFQIPSSAHNGKYRFEVGLISLNAPEEPLAVSQSEDRLLLDAFTASRQAVNPGAISNPLGMLLGETPLFTLLGYDLERPTVRRGEPLHLTLYWKSERRVATDYSIFLHLLDAEGKMLVQQDGPPEAGNAPTSWWLPGDIIADAHTLLIPSEIRPGRYMLAIGVYDSLRGPRLPIFDLAGESRGDSWELPVEVVGP